MQLFNRTKTVDYPLTIDTDAYSANDVIGGLIKLDFSSPGGGGVIRRLMLIDDDNEGAVLTIYIFDQAPSTIADDAAFAPTVADLKKKIGTVSVVAADYETLNSNKMVTKDGDDLNIDFETLSGNLWFYIVCTATPTYAAATDLTLRVTCWLD